MKPSVGADLCRVTIIAPRTRVDVALPIDVPLADLLPTLLRYAGEDLPDAGLLHGGWVLQRMGETPLDPGKSVATLGVRDGEILHFRPRQATLPELAFDDVVDAIATASQDRSDRWRPATTRRFSFGAALTMLVIGAFVLTFTGPDWAGPAAVAGVVGASLIVAGGILSRALGDAGAGALLGYAGLPYTYVCGLLILAEDEPLLVLNENGAGLLLEAPQMLVASATLLAAAILAAIAIAAGAPNFFGVASAALIAMIVSLVDIMFDSLTMAGIWAVGLSVALGLTSWIPMFSFRLARLPVPVVPTSADDLRRDNENVPGPKVLRQTATADRYMTGLVGALGGVSVVALFFLAFGSGWAPKTLCAVVVVTLLLRARLFFGRAQRLWLLLPALFGIGMLSLEYAMDGSHGNGAKLVGVVIPLLVVGGFVMMAGLRVPGARLSPWWGRSADIFEMFVVLSVIPLALAVLDVYSQVKSLAG